MGEAKMKELEQWEKTQFILAGYKRLCAACKSTPVERDMVKSFTSAVLTQHCQNCWKEVCRLGINCQHANTYFIVQN